MIDIACLYTCHNRRLKTLASLKSLFEASIEDVRLTVFITDDGCTDNTAGAINEMFPNEKIEIIKGDGTLFWAKGMIEAWKRAMSKPTDWDFYLLLNDDTILLPNLFKELFDAHKYALSCYGRAGIYSGFTCALNDPNKMTYGGNLWINGSYSKHIRLSPNGKPQLCNMTNANIFLVDKSVVEEIGIFYPYDHGCADNDYTISARKAGIPVILTANFCGKCDCDHNSDAESRVFLQKLSLKERKAYFQSPIHSMKDSITFNKRNFPSRVPLVVCGRILDLYFPWLYTFFHNILNVIKK